MWKLQILIELCRNLTISESRMIVAQESYWNAKDDCQLEYLMGKISLNSF